MEVAKKERKEEESQTREKLFWKEEENSVKSMGCRTRDQSSRPLSLSLNSIRVTLFRTTLDSQCLIN